MQNRQLQSGTRLVWARAGSMLQSRCVATRLPASTVAALADGPDRRHVRVIAQWLPAARAEAILSVDGAAA